MKKYLKILKGEILFCEKTQNFISLSEDTTFEFVHLNSKVNILNHHKFKEKLDNSSKEIPFQNKQLLILKTNWKFYYWFSENLIQLFKKQGEV